MGTTKGPNRWKLSEITKALPRACQDELAAVEFLEAQRWGEHVQCLYCTSPNVYQMRNSKTGLRAPRYLWRCRACKKQFTVRVGTVYEDSKIQLRHWCFAFWKSCSGKNGCSALEIKRQTGLSYESALFMLHRIRFAMTDEKPAPKLTGEVECDETFVGGRPRNGERNSPRADRLTAVVAVVQRDGDVRAKPIATVSASNLQEFLFENADRKSKLITDERSAYRTIGRHYKGGHQTVNHSEYEYVRGNVYTNTIEGFFSHLKRGIDGTYHAVSRHHLHRYVTEFAYRYNTRKLEDGERVKLAIKKSQGKRLFYKEPINRLGPWA